MKKSFQAIRNWSNANQGLLTLFTVIIAILSIIPFNEINLSFANSLFEQIWVIITYQIKVPAYLLILLVLAVLIYLLRIIKKYTTKRISMNFLNGTWKNEWATTGSEILQIKDGKYYVKDEHWFNIAGFKYDEEKGQIDFTKVSVRPDDKRELFNVLRIKNNELLIGTEEHGGNKYDIKYTKLSS